MTESTFSERVKALGLPLEQIIVVGSGILDQLSIRNSDDIDVVATSELFDELRGGDDFEFGESDGDEFCRKPGLEVFLTWFGEGYEEIVTDTELHDGVRYLNLQATVNWKKALGRDKDLRDIKLINDYLIGE